MRILVVDDDAISKFVLLEYLASVGECDGASDGREALGLFKKALAGKRPYQLVCLDVMMPDMDGQAALSGMRQAESENGIATGSGAKIIMITALFDGQNVVKAVEGKCDAYLVKPIEKAALFKELEKFWLIQSGVKK